MLRRILQPPTVKAPRYYITGDKHRHFNRLIQFCRAQRLERQDVIVILGDACVNYYGDDRDGALKRRLARLPVTLFFVQGNKENRPQNIATYGIRSFGGGTVYYEPQYPNLFFAKDGELYDLGGKEFLVIGGAHSVDKLRCLGEGLPFFADEEPDEATKARVEERLAARGWRVFGFLTHTCPVSYLPTEMFMSVRQATSANTELSVEGSGEDTQDTEEDFYPLDVDRTTEEWLETIRQRTDFSLWYCGHYHVDKALGKLRMMHKEILPLETGDGNET